MNKYPNMHPSYASFADVHKGRLASAMEEGRCLVLSSKDPNHYGDCVRAYKWRRTEIMKWIEDVSEATKIETGNANVYFDYFVFEDAIYMKLFMIHFNIVFEWNGPH